MHIFIQPGWMPYLIALGLLAMTLMASLALFLSVKRDMHAQASRNRAALETLVQQFHENVPIAAAEVVYVPAAARSGLNISKRVQAMRMARRNHDVSHIAAALGVTRREVELLIREQGISAARSS